MSADVPLCPLCAEPALSEVEWAGVQESHGVSGFPPPIKVGGRLCAGTTMGQQLDTKSSLCESLSGLSRADQGVHGLPLVDQLDIRKPSHVQVLRKFVKGERAAAFGADEHVDGK